MYDLILLGLFLVFTVIFLYTHRAKAKKEGLLILYKTHWGIKLIDKVGKKYPRTLRVFSHICVWLGYVLMVGVVYLVYTIVKLYVAHPEVVSQIKVPPIMPLIPYIDKVVTFLPPFYFFYWIVILAIIAIPHEFAHGIFSAYNNVKIRKTGFGFFPFFLPVFLAAFVEPDEKQMQERSNFGQRAILAAGTFANLLTAVVFMIITWLFFAAAFVPAGVSFDSYTYSPVPLSSITIVNNVSVNNVTMEKLQDLVVNASFNEIEAGGTSYRGIRGFYDEEIILLYDDSPAIRSGLNGAIISINDDKITNINDLTATLSQYSPGQEVEIKTKVKNEGMITKLTLGENPQNESKPWLGIGFVDTGSGGIMGRVFGVLSTFKDSHIYYESSLGEFGIFIYNLLWWLVIISISVALINMLPMGIFDGGRFFYLTILAITKSEKAAMRSYKFMTWLFILALILIMVIWGIGFFG